MVMQMTQQTMRYDADDLDGRRDSLYDGIGHRPIKRPDTDREITRGSPWALAPWPTLEIANAVRYGVERYLPGRGNRDLIAAAGDDPQERLEAVMRECVVPALADVRDQLIDEGYDADLQCHGTRAVLRTRGFNGREIAYTAEGGVYRAPVVSLAAIQPDEAGPRYARIDIASRGTTREARLHHCSRAAMRRHALHDLRNQMLY